MEALFNVIFTGELKPGTDRETFVRNFRQKFQCDEAKAASVLDAGKALTMKSGVTEEVAGKLKQVLEALGMNIAIQPAAPTTVTPTTTAAPEPTQAATNPYEAPKADLDKGGADGEMTGPVTVPFGHGANWISDAFSRHFKLNPGAWIGAFVLFSILTIVLQLIPLLGPIVSALLSPVFMAGFMLGARAQDEGEDFTVGHLFSGFKGSTGQLMLVGVLYLIGTIFVIVVPMLMMGGSMAMLGGMEQGDPAAAQAMMQNPVAILLPILVMLLLMFPLITAYWFAPALVVFEGVSALVAMKMSFSGGMKNILPFTLYGIVLLILGIVASLPLLLGLLILFPVMMASIYTAYRDIYYPTT